MKNERILMFSDIVPVTRELIKNKKKYYLFTIGKIFDDFSIRMLIYKHGIFIEQIRRTDCDNLNDVIIAEKFNFDELPKRWPLVRNMSFLDSGCSEYEQYVSLVKYKQFVDEFI